MGIDLRPCGLLVLATVVSAFGRAPQDANAPAKVPDSATAVRIAEQALSKIYGQKKIAFERPFTATLSDDVWHVYGTLYCGKVSASAHCLGGVARADVRQSDGRVVRTGHGK